MRKDKKILELIDIVSALPSDNLDKEIAMLAAGCEVDWTYTALMSLAGALKTVSKGTKYEELSTEIIEKCSYITNLPIRETVNIPSKYCAECSQEQFLACGNMELHIVRPCGYKPNN